jgi:general secretion pathway protein C
MSFPASLREFQSASPQQWLDRASRTLPQALSVVLVIAIAWQLVQLLWLALDRAQPSETILPPAPVNVPGVARKGIDVQSIVAAHLFGVPQSEAPAQAEVRDTQVNLVLSAVFAANDPSKGMAIIGESAQATKVFGVGASVRPGILLHAVHADRVILDRGGSLEQLMLPKQNTAGLSINRAAPRPSAGSQFADNIRRIAETNPTAFTEIVRPQPVFANGVQRGYRVYPGRNRQQFAKLGLQPGDLVLSINGTPLDDPARGMEIFNTIGTSDRVQVTVERNGQSQEMTLNTAQIMLPDPNAAPPPDRPMGGPRQLQPQPDVNPE